MLRRVGGGCSQLNAEGSSWLLRAEQTPPTGGSRWQYLSALFYRNEFS